MKLTQSLSQEHRVIEQVLRCLLSMASRAEAEGTVDADSAESAVRFFRTFADTCHHAKEENVLFPALGRKGLGPSAGPVAVMLEEHESGRKRLARLEAAIPRARARADGAIREFCEAARGYAELLTQHIAKEDHVLFPLADQVLGGEEAAGVHAGFARAEEALDHGALHADMIGIADALGKKFEVVRAETPGDFHGCCHAPR